MNTQCPTRFSESSLRLRQVGFYICCFAVFIISIVLWQKPVVAGDGPPMLQTEEAVPRENSQSNCEEDYVTNFQKDVIYPYVAYGGEVVAGSFMYAVEKLKYGIHPDFERLVFYVSETDESERINYRLRIQPTVYKFVLLEGQKRAEIRITAERSRIALEAAADFTSSPLIEKVEEKRVCDWMWYVITFKQPVQARVFELDHPGRIVIDVEPVGK